jgi:hypothetical protein
VNSSVRDANIFIDEINQAFEATDRAATSATATELQAWAARELEEARAFQVATCGETVKANDVDMLQSLEDLATSIHNMLRAETEADFEMRATLTDMHYQSARVALTSLAMTTTVPTQC